MKNKTSNRRLIFQLAAVVVLIVIAYAMTIVGPSDQSILISCKGIIILSRPLLLKCLLLLCKLFILEYGVDLKFHFRDIRLLFTDNFLKVFQIHSEK